MISRRGALLSAVLSTLPGIARARSDELEVATAAYEEASGGRIGVYAENVASGQTLSWRPDERFVMCSTFKASLAALVLTHVDHRREDLLTPIPYTAADLRDWHAPVAAANVGTGALSVGAMCAGAVEQSDNTCATMLLTRVGGPAALTAFWREVGDDVSRLDDPELQLNFVPPGSDRNTTTPRAMVENFRRFALGDILSPSSWQLFRSWLIGSVTGFDRLRGGLPTHWVVGDKTGNNGRDAAGDVAIAWPTPERPLLIAAYTRGGTPDDAHLKTVFAAIGSAAARRLG